MKSLCFIAGAYGVLLASHGWAQVSSVPPAQFESANPVGLEPRLELAHNTPERLCRELLDTNTVRAIAASAGITQQGPWAFVIAPDPGGTGIWLYRLTDHDLEGCARFARCLQSYVEARLDGHTRRCLLAAITNQVPPSAVRNPDLRLLISQNPLLPASWLKSSETNIVSGLSTQRPNPGTVGAGRCASFDLTDGDVTWRYTLYFKADGAFAKLTEVKFDAKDIDPRFTGAMNEVDREVKATLESTERLGRVGTANEFWVMKKRALKNRGIEWRSPAELNPGLIFD